MTLACIKMPGTARVTTVPQLVYVITRVSSLWQTGLVVWKTLHLASLVIKVRVVLDVEDARLDELSHLPALGRRHPLPSPPGCGWFLCHLIKQESIMQQAK